MRVLPSLMGPAIAGVLSLVLPVPGFAQSDTRTELVFLRAAVDVVQPYVPIAHPVPDTVVLPPNLVVSSLWQPVVDTMLRRSQTFGRQCLRIASAQKLTVVLDSEPPPASVNALAITRIVRNADGTWVAVVRIRFSTRAVELIAHELEHVIEQLDGIDLQSKARLTSTGVRSCACGDTAFETARAVRVGSTVALEVGDAN